jgi:hypothetical protein
MRSDNSVSNLSVKEGKTSQRWRIGLKEGQLALVSSRFCFVVA